MKQKIILLALSAILLLALTPVWGENIPAENPSPSTETATSAGGGDQSVLWWRNPVKPTQASVPAQPEVKDNILSGAVPAEAKSQTAEKSAKPSNIPVYKVQNGDSLIVIAKAYGVSVAGIMQANNLTSSSLLRVGQSLKIPGGIAPTGRKVGSPAVSKPAPAQLAAEPAATLPVVSADENFSTNDQAVNASASLPAVPAEKAGPGYLFGEASKKTAGPNLLGGAGTLFSLILKLGFVIILAYVAARAARRFALRNGKGASAPAPAPAKNSNSHNNMEILETITLGPERWIHVVTIGSKAYLLSSTPQQTALITEVTETNLIQELREKQALESGFAGQLAQCMAGSQEHRQRQKSGGTYTNNFFAAKLAELNPFGGRQ